MFDIKEFLWERTKWQETEEKMSNLITEEAATV